MNTKNITIDHKDIDSCNIDFKMSDNAIKLPELTDTIKRNDRSGDARVRC